MRKYVRINNIVSDAICSVAVKHGATIRTNAEVVEIVCEHGRAVGARTADGNTFFAPVSINVSICVCIYYIRIKSFPMSINVLSLSILRYSSYQCMCGVLGYRLQLHAVSNYGRAAAARDASRGI